MMRGTGKIGTPRDARRPDVTLGALVSGALALAWVATAVALPACGGGVRAARDDGNGGGGASAGSDAAGGESATAGDGGDGTTAPEDPEWAAKVAAGEARYEAVCGTCHPAGEEDMGPRLIGLRWSADRMRAQIRNGSGRMRPIPPARLSDTDLDNVLAWLTTIRAVQR